MAINVQSLFAVIIYTWRHFLQNILVSTDIPDVCCIPEFYILLLSCFHVVYYLYLR